MLLLNAGAVRKSLPMGSAIEAMRVAFAALHTNNSSMPERIHVPLDGAEGVMLVMPASVGTAGGQSTVTKVVSVVPSNADRDIPLIHSAVLVVKPDTGEIEALVDGASLTAIRTAAASGLATDLLARADSSKLAVLGAGVQARSHVDAMLTVRPIGSVTLYSRTAARAERLIEELVEIHPDLSITSVTSAAKAVGNADIVCCTTTARTPIFDDADIQPGTHINAVGSFTPDAREIPAATIVRSRTFVDHREAALAEAGDILLPIAEGLISPEHVLADLGELLTGAGSGRQSDKEVTVFKSVGIAVQDAVAATIAVENAKQRGLGQRVAF